MLTGPICKRIVGHDGARFRLSARQTSVDSVVRLGTLRAVVIRAKAPLRISFAGGGTDVPPFPAREGGLVLNATINRYAYGTLRARQDESITIHSYDYGSSVELSTREAFVFDGRLDLAKAAIVRFTGGTERGFDLLLHSNAPPGSGLGASSAMMVALIGVLAEFRNVPVTDYELAELAHAIEREELGISGGRQDQYAATFGGFNFIELDGDRVVVNPLRIAPDIVLELEHNLLLCYTGTTRQSDHIIDDQMGRYERGDAEATAGLRAQKELATEMKNALLQRRLTDFGELLNAAWEAKQLMSERISNQRIDDLYRNARAAGAVGGKVTGAGGGGYLMLYCQDERKHEVAAKMRELGAEVNEFAFENSGLRTWRADGVR
jgi:D-glycero-alpha-D-manno-heptose-7-phosphate kinase